MIDARTAALAGAASLIIGTLATSLTPLPATAQPACAADGPGDVELVCGPRNAEDIIRLDETGWLIASGMSTDTLTGGGDPGHIYLIDAEARSYTEWFPGDNPSFAHDETLYGDCPGPLNTDSFSSHGLSLQAQSASRYRLYMTSHGEREAIEMFEVDTTGESPTITWVGCVPLAETTFSNSVAILDDGGFMTTKMMDPTDPAGFGTVMGGAISGEVFAWRPGEAVMAVPNTELSGANGIAVSDDGRYLYVAAIGSAEVLRYDLEASPPAKESVSIPIRPDNLRWSDAGTLYTTGGNYTQGEQESGWSVIEIDPETLEAERVASGEDIPGMAGLSVALPVGDELWLGTFNGDRIAIVPR